MRQIAIQNTRKRKLRQRGRSNTLSYLLLISVPLLFFIVFLIVPNITSYCYSLFEYDGFSEPKFIGFQNFVSLANDRLFWVAAKNTVVYTVTTMIVQNGIALALAVLLKKSTTVNNLFKTVNYLPAIVSSIAIGFIWGFILDPNIGALNALFDLMGLKDLKQNWLGNANLVMFSISAIHCWQSIGGATIIFISGMLDIPQDLYDSAAVAGANSWQTFWRITFPLLKPVTQINLVLTMIGCFKSFDYVYVMTGGGGDGASHVLATLLYKNGFSYFRVGYSSSIAVILSVIAIVFALLQLQFSRSDD